MKHKPPAKDKCPACGVPFVDHVGLISICRDLQTVQQRLASVMTLVRTLRMDRHVRDYLLDVAEGKK